MHTKLKASLQIKIQEWLDENCDDIGSICGIYQDDTNADATALILATAAESAVDAMEHQSELIRRMEDD